MKSNYKVRSVPKCKEALGRQCLRSTQGKETTNWTLF